MMFTCPLSAQVFWSSPEVRSLGGGEYEVSVTATIEEGWAIYDLTEYKDGPNRTTFTVAEQSGVELIGEVETMPQSTKKMDEIFQMEIGKFTGEVTLSQRVRVDSDRGVEFKVEWMACSGMMCSPPDELLFSVDLQGAKGMSWWVIIEAILWGIAALLTPCVFPMVPMTIAYFMKGSGGGRLAALLFGAFIVALYTIPIGVVILVTYLFGWGTITADIFNWVATHWLPNLFFFAIFMLFAASFFGVFELSLPSSWVNRADAKGDRGSVGGVFFLALTLVLVSFSCTGPIVGSVLIKSTSGEVWQPVVTMLAFSLAFAMPFVGVALFPALLQRMPKSGGWLSSVKIVLGFLELALGLKFLSVADQTYHWGLLSRELYLIIWVVIFAMLGFYLLGKLRFAHEQRVESIGFGRLLLSIVTFTFTLYLLSGLWGAPLKGLSGYLPPPTASESISVVSDVVVGQREVEQAQKRANSEGKPLLVDLTGYGCVNCREMEQRVWSDERVAQTLRDEYVVVALYLDDKREAPESEWVTTDSGSVLKSVGRINSHYALSRFGVNAQPYYIILGRDGEPIVEPRGYNLNVDEYIDFLKRGINGYNNMIF
ncbi:MAG: cytochrome c biogenesis protein CcdA [Rikenellaceae bacterium]